MDFNIGWGTDEIAPVTIHDYGMYDNTMTNATIQKNIKYPTHKYPDPKIQPSLVVDNLYQKQKKDVEGFVGTYNNDNDGIINEKTLIIMLLVILVILCTVMYHSIKQTQETMRLLLTMLVVQHKPKI